MTLMTSLDWLKKLVSFDTTSCNSNLSMIQFIADYCQSLGLQPHLSFNQEGNKANLFVSIADYQQQIQGGLVLSGHTDVVPVTGQNWATDPFTAHIQDNKVYGRGTADMKGFIACVLNFLPQATKIPLKEPIHLAFSFDEEIGCLGVSHLLSDLKSRNIQPNKCIIGEPTNMKMIVAHKGIQVIRCKVSGHSCHSSLTPSGVNAVEYAARLIVFISDLAESLKKRTDNDEDFDVPFSTLSTNLIQGGHAMNIVPNECEFTFDYRNLPHMSANEIIEPIEQFIQQHLLPKMKMVAPNSRIELETLAHVPALNQHEQNKLYQLIENLLDQQSRQKVAFTTEGGHFDLAGMHTVICGPGDINQAHQPNEFIEMNQLQICDHFLQQLLSKYHYNQ